MRRWQADSWLSRCRQYCLSPGWKSPAKSSVPLAAPTTLALPRVLSSTARHAIDRRRAGREMIIAGGNATGNFNNGARYNPATDTWTAISTANAPTARTYHTAVWTGSEMIVWGGYNNGIDLNTGGRYNPNTDSLDSYQSRQRAGRTRVSHRSLDRQRNDCLGWIGCGSNCRLNTGGRYNPSYRQLDGDEHRQRACGTMEPQSALDRE